MDHHRKLATFVGLPSLAALAVIALTPPEPRGLPDAFGFCLMLGTMYAQVTLLAAWMAFGPLPLLWRLPLSLVAVLCLIVATGINLMLYHRSEFEMLIVLAGCLLGQWFIAQLPLWGLGLAYGLRLQHLDEINRAIDPRDRQFGIRELLIFTTIIAVILGIGRVVVARLPRSFVGNDEIGIFIFLAVAAVFFALTLLVAGLLPRYAGLALAIGVLAIAFVTLAEAPLMDTLVRRRGGPETWHLALINAGTASWILAYVYAIRRAGYRLGISPVQSG